MSILRTFLSAAALVFWGFEVALGQMLVVEFSDNHSAYEHLPNFLRVYDRVTRDYLRREPQGRVVVLVNGDFAGTSAWAGDRGWRGVRALGELTSAADVLVTLGNHDGFDFALPENPSGLVVNQFRYLKSKGAKVLVANARTPPGGESPIEPRSTIALANGRRIRFVGLALEKDEMIEKSPWRPQANDPLMTDLVSGDSTLRSEFHLGSADGVDEIVFFRHEGLSRFSRALTSAFPARGDVSRPRVAVAFAAHDHRRQELLLQNGVRLIDSGSDYEFSAIELSADGEWQPVQTFDLARQKALAQNLSDADSALGKLARSTEQGLEVMRRTFHRLGETSGFEEVKLDLKRGRGAVGIAVADILRSWGRSFPEVGLLPVYSFFHSSSYRLDSPIRPGPLYFEQVRGIYPFEGQKVGLFRTTEAQVSKLFRAIRSEVEAKYQSYTPQTSSNLFEGRGYQLATEDGGEFRSLAEDRPCFLVLDSWIFRNGVEVPAVAQFLASHSPLETSDVHEVFRGFAGPALRSSEPYQQHRICPLLAK